MLKLAIFIGIAVLLFVIASSWIVVTGAKLIGIIIICIGVGVALGFFKKKG